MSLISFKNTPVSINGTSIIASQASISQSISNERVDGLGKGNAGVIFSDRPSTNFNAEFYIDSSSYGLITNLTGAQFDIILAGITVTGCYLTSSSVTIDPNTLIKGNVSATSYGNTQAINPSSQPTGSFGDAKTILAHGIATTVAGVTGQARAVSINISQNNTPSYAIGTSSLIGLKIEGEITASVEGYESQGNLGNICAGSTSSVSAALKSYCGDAIGTIGVSGMTARSFDVSVSAGDFLIGKAEFVKYF